MTHTYAVLRVSQDTYEEIRAKLLDAGYAHQFDGVLGSVDEVIDMHGIGLQCAREEDTVPLC